jgi:hypothetical protein
MKSNTPLFVGLASIVFTAALIWDFVHTPSRMSPFLWMMAFIAVSGIFFFAYLVNEWRAWKWLFPACICAAISEIIFALTFNAVNDLWVWVFGFAGILIPALIAYFTQPRRANLPIMQQA